MSFDAAILTLPADDVTADVIIELGASEAGSVGRVTTATQSQDVTLRSPQQLLLLLDRLLPASTARVSPIGRRHG